MKPTHRYFT